MAVSYNRLWKLLIDKNMSVAEMRRAADIAPNTVTRMKKDQEVTMSVLEKICAVLDADFGDIVAILVLEANPAVDLGVGVGVFLVKTESVIFAGDFVGRGVDAESEGGFAGVGDFDGATFVDFVGAAIVAGVNALAGLQGEAEGSRGNLEPGGFGLLDFGRDR